MELSKAIHEAAMASTFICPGSKLFVLLRGRARFVAAAAAAAVSRQQCVSVVQRFSLSLIRSVGRSLVRSDRRSVAVYSQNCCHIVIRQAALTTYS